MSASPERQLGSPDEDKNVIAQETGTADAEPTAPAEETESKPVQEEGEEAEAEAESKPAKGDAEDEHEREPAEDAEDRPVEENTEAQPAEENAEAQPVEGDEKPDADENENAGMSDDESILSEVDEAQFEDFDPENLQIEERPQLAIDEDNLKLIGRHKRKRTQEDGDEGRSRRKKEGRREKKNRRMRELEGVEDEGDGGGGRRSRRGERKRRDQSPMDEELLDPATRMFFLVTTHDAQVLSSEVADIDNEQVVAELSIVPWTKP